MPRIDVSLVTRFVGGLDVEVDTTQYNIDEYCEECNICDIPLDQYAVPREPMLLSWWIYRKADGLVMLTDDKWIFDDDTAFQNPNTLFPQTMLNVSGWLICIPCSEMIRKLISLEDQYRRDPGALTLLYSVLDPFLLPPLINLILRYLTECQLVRF